MGAGTAAGDKMVDESAAAKAALREAALRARRNLDPQARRCANEAIVQRLLAVPEIATARTVATYAAMGDEADPGGALTVLRERGVRTLFPRVRGVEVDLVAATDLLALALGYRGIREPAGPPVDPSVVDVACVPGVAFDLSGARLGHGGGHYDRLLARLPGRCLRIGLAYACQVVPRVPRSAHDQPVDLVVTETATYRSRGADPGA